MPHVNTPPLSPVHPHGAPAAQLNAAMEASDCFIALQMMINNITAAAPSLMHQLEGQTVESVR